jgi:hypothetical protein
VNNPTALTVYGTLVLLHEISMPIIESGPNAKAIHAKKLKIENQHNSKPRKQYKIVNLMMNKLIDCNFYSYELEPHVA